MPEEFDNPNAKRYRTELIVIIAMMVIVAAFILKYIL